jgi:hypothetical protein
VMILIRGWRATAVRVVSAHARGIREAKEIPRVPVNTRGACTSTTASSVIGIHGQLNRSPTLFRDMSGGATGRVRLAIR